jgi:RNA polymerase sigma-70 factor, ECF subfamily
MHILGTKLPYCSIADSQILTQLARILPHGRTFVMFDAAAACYVQGRSLCVGVGKERCMSVSAAGRGGVWMNLVALLTGASAPPRAVVGLHSAMLNRRALVRHGSERDGDESARCERIEAPGGASALLSADPAFDAFFQQHEQPLYGYLRRLLPTHEIALEVAQEAFFRAWTHFEKVRAYERPEAWLYRVATNLAISQLRQRHPMSFAQAFRRAGGEEEDGDSGEEDALADPLDIEGDAAARDLITRVLLRLPERQRAVLLLRAVHDFSGEEIAEMLGISLANARQILSRGRERFRQLCEATLRGETDEQ